MRLICIRYAPAMLLLASACFADDVTVRVISAKNGRPLVGERVQLVVFRPVPRGAPDDPVVFKKYEYTATKGEAVFHTQVPANASIGVGGIQDQCSPGVYRADEMMKTGVAVERCPHRPKRGFGLPVHPGEIVIYAGQYSWLERALWMRPPWF